MSFEKQLTQVEAAYVHDIKACDSSAQLEQVRLKYLGRKNGLVTVLLKSMGSMDITSKRSMGPRLQSLKKDLTALLQTKFDVLGSASVAMGDVFDVTLPGIHHPCGAKHPITQVMEEIIEFFRRMGFDVATGPDIETDYYNFEALNIPKNHPARDMQDTFYLAGDLVLRTHTSPVQIHVMEHTQPPVQIIAPGKVYRRDADVSHTPMFHQVEGLMVGEDITMGHLMDVLDRFVKAIFSDKIRTRFRPSFFSFTEPSVEVDISCVFCHELGCRVCKDSGWLEILGAGMVDPAVLEHVAYDPEQYGGFAFGMGVERIAMLKYGIDDIRLFFENDLRFLRQF